MRGKKDKKVMIGDAEQQALIKAGKDEGEGGELVLGHVQLPDLRASQWHALTLRFEGASITGFVNGTPVLTVTNRLYSRGMAGLMAGQDRNRISMPYFDEVKIIGINALPPKPSSPSPKQSPIYHALVSGR